MDRKVTIYLPTHTPPDAFNRVCGLMARIVEVHDFWKTMVISFMFSDVDMVTMEYNFGGDPHRYAFTLCRMLQDIVDPSKNLLPIRGDDCQ